MNSEWKEKSLFKTLTIVNIVVLPVVIIHCGKEEGISKEITPKNPKFGCKTKRTWLRAGYNKQSFSCNRIVKADSGIKPQQYSAQKKGL